MSRQVDYDALYQEMVALENRHWWFRSHYTWILDLLNPYLVPGSRLLDLGCGPGVFASKLPSSVSVVLVDIRSLALSYCHSKALGRVCGDAAAIPLKERQFDIVICSDLLHQRSVKDPRRVVLEAVRVCRPGGIILLVEPAFNCLFGPHDEVENGCRRYTTRRLLDLFGNNPVILLRRTYFHILMFGPAFLVRRVFSNFTSQKSTDLAIGNHLTNTLSYWAENAECWINRFVPLPFGTSAAVLVQREKA